MKKIFLTLLFITALFSIYIYTDSNISWAAYNDVFTNPSKIPSASLAVISTHTLTEGNYLPLPCNISTFPYGYGFGTTGTIDTCWSIVQVVGSYGWTLATSMSYPTMSPYQGPYMAVFPSFSYNGIQSRIQSPVFNFTSLTHPTLSFYMTRDNGYPAPKDSIVVEVSTDNGTSWVYAASYQRYSTNTTPTWEQKIVELTTYSGNSNVTVGIRGVSMYGNNIGLDTIVIFQGSSTPIVSTATPIPTGSYTGISGGTVATGGPLTAEGVCWNTS